MSEHQARDERVRMREAQEAAVKRAQDDQINKTLAVLRKDYEGIKNLLPDTNPTAWKSLMFLRAKLRRFRTQWRAKLADIKVPKEERDCLIGQINTALLIFDLIDQISGINKELEPGKEIEILRAKMFRAPQQPGGVR